MCAYTFRLRINFIAFYALIIMFHNIHANKKNGVNQVFLDLPPVSFSFFYLEATVMLLPSFS